MLKKGDLHKTDFSQFKTVPVGKNPIPVEFVYQGRIGLIIRTKETSEVLATLLLYNLSDEDDIRQGFTLVYHNHGDLGWKVCTRRMDLIAGVIENVYLLRSQIWPELEEGAPLVVTPPKKALDLLLEV